MKHTRPKIDVPIHIERTLRIIPLILLLAVTGCRQTAPRDAADGSAGDGAAVEQAAEAPVDEHGMPLVPGTGHVVSVETTAEMLASGEALLIDVREPDEYERGHIPGITLIPMDQVQDRLDEIPDDRPVIFSCRSGNRSGQVADMLREQGYDQVYNQEGGILAWQAAGQPIER